MIVPAAKIAEDFGFTARHWTRLASAGKVPGAYQPSGERGHWLFDLSEFKGWWATKRRRAAEWRASTGAAQRGGAASSVKARISGKASTQEIDDLLRSVLGSG